MKLKKHLRKSKNKTSKISADDGEDGKIVIEPINSSSWWAIGNHGVILGCGNLQGRSAQNKGVLYSLLEKQFATEAFYYGANFFNFYKNKN